MKILVVDDSATMRKIEIKILAQLGYTDIIEAEDGVQALEQMAESPGLILLDWNMPNMDGLTFVQTVRSKGIRTPIIMVTTEAERARVIQAIQAGINNYVVKPFTPPALSKTIATTLAKAAA